MTASFPSLRIGFMGTPDFVLPLLAALRDSGHDLVAIYTQPAREKGRKRILQKTPVHLWGEENNIAVHTPENFKHPDAIDTFQELKLDVAIVAAYGLLLPQAILDAPTHGCINIHPSLLPRWRGPSPIQYAIWKGDAQTGVSVMALEKAMDSGPILAQKPLEIAGQNFEELNPKLWALGTDLLMSVLEGLAQNGHLNPTAQAEEGVTYCKLLTKEEGHIDWTQKAREIDQQIRGLNPWPGTWCFDAHGKRMKILSARVSNEQRDAPAGQVVDNGQVSCGGGTLLALERLQPENKNPMDIKAALNGGFIAAGMIFT